MTFDEIRLDAREKADELETGFINDAQLDRFLDQGHLYVYGKLAQKFEDWFTIPGTLGNGGLFTTAANTLEYNLPTTMKKLVRVEGRVPTSLTENDWRKIRSISLGERKIPYVDSTTYQIRLWFVPERTKLALGTDVPSVPEAYHYSIAEYAALQCLRKSGEAIWKEAMDVFKVDLEYLMETGEVRNLEPERMVVTEHYPSDYEDFLYNTAGTGCVYMLAGQKIYVGYDPKLYLRAF